ncbi:MAG: hypothetical protein K2N73_15100 [Lachnospiraceae bacterium]|nr:hypothetical protein [Lachnospiraceae bacterium]
MNKMKHCFISKDNAERNLFRMRIRHCGPLNSNKIIYYIAENNKNLGFFAMYRYWLEYLYFADVCGYIPVINVGSEFSYADMEKVNETRNPFEYYFNQPALIGVKSAKMSRNVINADIVHRQMVELIFTGKYCNYKANKRYMNAMGYIVKKYMRFNQSTWEYISMGMNQLNIDKGKILGVHIRGTDFRASYNNHPVYITEEECFKEIDVLLYKKPYTRIFVATDDSRILKRFVEKYERRICYYDDIIRSDKNQSVAFSKNSRKNHKYLLGLEVIRDMYTLSVCSGLVAGVSQVAICAHINKLARGEHYEDIKIIDKGLNDNSHIFMRHS